MGTDKEKPIQFYFVKGDFVLSCFILLSNGEPTPTPMPMPMPMHVHAHTLCYGRQSEHKSIMSAETCVETCTDTCV